MATDPPRTLQRFKGHWTRLHQREFDSAIRGYSCISPIHGIIGRFHFRASWLDDKRRRREFRIFGFGRSASSEGTAAVRCCICRSTLVSPRYPAAASRWPILVFNRSDCTKLLYPLMLCRKAWLKPASLSIGVAQARFLFRALPMVTNRPAHSLATSHCAATTFPLGYRNFLER